MRVPIVTQGDYVIASPEFALRDGELVRLRDDIATEAGRHRPKGVILDFSEVDVLDSFATRTVRDLARMVQERGTRTVIVGIQPEIQFAMLRLGVQWDEVTTAPDLEHALVLLRNDENH